MMVRIIFLTLLALVGLSLCGQTAKPPRSTPEPMKLAEYSRAAIEEFQSGASRGPEFWRMMEYRVAEGEVDLRTDPYLAWLQFRLMHDAMSGKLFVETAEPDGVVMRLTWEMADNEAWYVCVVESNNEGRSINPALPATLIWPYYGDRVTRNGPGDDPSTTDYPLVEVASGDLAHFDLYRLPRGYARHHMELVPSKAIESDEAKLVIRMTLPVITEP